MKIPLSKYRNWNFEGLKLFRLKAEPSFSPIDIGLHNLFEKFGWEYSDRFRFFYPQETNKMPSALKQLLENVPPHITLRKIDFEEDCLCHCMLLLNGDIEIFSNDDEFAKNLFKNVFVNVPPGFHKRREWKVTEVWLSEPTIIAWFSGSLAGALGWGSEQVPAEVSESLFEATQNLKAKRYLSCVIMCRRSIEALLRFAYRRFFKEELKAKKDKELTLNEIIRRFEGARPEIMPRHWINILDSIRELGNIPGAHPRRIPGYRFTREDAILTLTNTTSFIETYLERSTKRVGLFIHLRSNLKKTK